jgi:hypothetical protein
VVGKIKLDRVILSWDQFRAPFIKKLDFIELAKWLRSKEIEVIINLVLTTPDDLIEVKDFEAAGLTVLLNGVIRAGRFSQPAGEYFSDHHAVHRTCPSISSAIDRAGYEKIIFIPGSGFTPCCGPIAFDREGIAAEVFSPSIEQYENNQLLFNLRKGSFAEQAKTFGFQISEDDVNSACEACRILYGRIDGMPPLYKIGVSDAPQFFSTRQKLSTTLAKILTSKYHVAYLFGASREIIDRIAPSPMPEGIETQNVDSSNLEQTLEFIKSNYYDRHAGEYSRADIEKFFASAEGYFALGVSGRIYLKAGAVVGCVLANRFENYPLINKPTVHMGYAGYDKTLLTRDESGALKSDWRAIVLSLLQEGDICDASVKVFNTNAFHFLEKIGFELLGVRLDSKQAIR